jgi:hypothetical protein
MFSNFGRWANRRISENPGRFFRVLGIPFFGLCCFGPMIYGFYRIKDRARGGIFVIINL